MMAAWALGFLGSFHCIGMCGPIALALPLPAQHWVARITGILLYNGGRLITYALFGALFGWLGKSFVIAGYQQALSIGLGVLILLVVLLPTKIFSASGMTKVMFYPVAKLKSSLGYLFHQKSFSALFALGLLNGLLPCGLVYIGVAGAIATGSVAGGSVFMMLFGAGTLPAMALVSVFSSQMSAEWRSKIRRVVPLMVILMAGMLILRGMNLGIPYISPGLSKTDCTEHRCCHPEK